VDDGPDWAGGWGRCQSTVGQDLVVVLVFLRTDAELHEPDSGGGCGERDRYDDAVAVFGTKSSVMTVMESGRLPHRRSMMRAYKWGESLHHSLL
jgi:hypothetical protein